MAVMKLKNIYENEILRLRVEFDDDAKLSLNKIWSWWAATPWLRKKAADIFHEDIWTFLETKRIPKIAEKVDMFFMFYFSTWDSWGKRQLDSSNCVAMSKIIEDSFKFDKVKNPKGILVDDTNMQCWWHSVHSIPMTLAERKALDSSYVEVSIRKHNHNIL